MAQSHPATRVRTFPAAPSSATPRTIQTKRRTPQSPPLAALLDKDARRQTPPPKARFPPTRCASARLIAVANSRDKSLPRKSPPPQLHPGQHNPQKDQFKKHRSQV